MTPFLLHMFGDFIIQNDWMASNKKKKTLPGELACQIHCITYALPFMMISTPLQVFFIYAAHYIIDRSNLVPWFIALRNGVGHIRNFGSKDEKPFAITIWICFIVDNIFHVLSNELIMKFF